MKIIVMNRFNGILFHKSGPANKQHTNHSLLYGLGVSVFRSPVAMFYSMLSLEEATGSLNDRSAETLQLCVLLYMVHRNLCNLDIAIISIQ